MSNYSALIATINANIKANNNHEITGAITNSVLNAMVNTLGAGYQFMGVATPTNPGSAQTPDYKCFYIATTPGTYTNLGGLVVADGEVAILKYDTSWTKEVTGAATADQLNQLGQYDTDPEYLRVYTDEDGRILFGIKTDGGIDWAIGIPAPVKDYIDKEVLAIYSGSSGNTLDGLSKIEHFLNGLSSNMRLKDILDSLEERTPDIVNDPEFMSLLTDNQDKILEGISNGVKRIEIPCVFGSDVTFRKQLPKQIVNYVDFKAVNDRIEDILQQCKCPDQVTNVTPPDGYKTPQLCLIHYSDIHKDYDRTKRIMVFREKYAEYIDDILLTGDSANYYSDYDSDIFEIPGYEKVLNVIGNHDAYANSGGTEFATPQQKYERWMMGKTSAQSQNDFISGWGVVQPSGAGENDYYPCYYYKDYTDKNIRLIVIDCMESYGDGGEERDATQLAWFTSVLADAKTNGFHIIVSDHYPVGNDINDYTQLSGAFNYLSNPTYGSGYKIDDYADAIDTFITEGGIFVCWLCGHLHYDFTAYANSHPKQLYLAVPTANINAHISFRKRMVGNENEDCFNIVAVDTETKTIRVARIGSQFDRFLQHQGTMCISYNLSDNANPTLVYHW